jgi:hypothetical protein
MGPAREWVDAILLDSGLAHYDGYGRQGLLLLVLERTSLIRSLTSVDDCRFNRSPQHIRRISPLVSDTATSFWAAR